MTHELACEYVHTISVGNLEQCRKAIQETKHRLKQLYDGRSIRGYQLLLIKNRNVVEDKLIEPIDPALTSLNSNTM
jgi:hypothetical protein